MIPNTQVTNVGVHVQQIQPQLSLVTNLTPINQHLGWPQPVTLIVVRQPRIVLYMMWYNTIRFFVPMDSNMHSMYYLGIKEPDPLISRRKKPYAVDVI